MKRIPIVVAGGGLIAQVEHIPNLLHLASLFELRAVADPSAKVRAHIERQFGVRAVANVEDLYSFAPEAMVVATPDAWHHDLSAEALDRGLHVLCEKPLSVRESDIEDLIRRRDRTRSVLQVGTMKRFDPSYEALRTMVAGRGKQLRFLAVECNDPDSWPFVAHHAFLRGDDVAMDLRQETRAKLASQVADALGRPVDDELIYAYVESYSSSMIHDLNAVNGLFEAMGIQEATPVAGQIFASGRGTSGTLSLNGGQALAHLVHVVVPALADYNERISLFFDDRRYELCFPSPYLKNLPTTLTEWRSDGMLLSKTEFRDGFGESFVRELEGFHAAITSGAPVINRPEHALTDLRIIRRFMDFVLAGRTGGT